MPDRAGNMSSLPTLFQAGKLVGEGLSDVVPIDYIVNWFRDRDSKVGVQNRVLVLKSETASGKSTVIPPVLFRANIGATGGAGQRRGMIVTQPRVLTAISNVEEIRKHNKFTDQEIGHSTKYDKMRPARSGLLSATIGTLTAQLNSSTDDEIASRYKYIMIDEAHERNVDLDITLALLKRLLLRMNDRDDCPFVILASATFDPDQFLQYFGLERKTNFIWCEGATHPIDERWEYLGDHYSVRYVASITDIVMKISNEDKSERSDVLVFLPGLGEIRNAAEALMKINIGLAKKSPADVFLLLSIDSTAVNQDKRDNRLLKAPLESSMQVVSGKQYKPRRRVILSTVVAETGLTLSDLKYVIDVGFSREIEYSPNVGASGLITKPAPRSRIKQRRGRAGRNAPGVFYPLYPRHLFDKLQETQYPEIVTSDCTNYLLTLIGMQIRDRAADNYAIGDPDSFDPTNIDMVTKPPADSLCAALRTFHNIGLLREMRLTELGKIAMKLSSVTPQCARAIMSAYYWGAPVEDTVRACCFVLSDIEAAKIDWWKVYHIAGFAKTPSAYGRIRLAMCDQFVEGAILYRALENAARDQTLAEFCTVIGADLERTKTYVETVDDTLSLMIQAEMKIGGVLNPDADPREFMRGVDAMKHCFYDGFRDNLLVLVDGERVYSRASDPRVTCAVPDILADNRASRDEARVTGAQITSLPRFVIAANLNIASVKKAQNIKTYELRATYISVMDGFFSPDLTYGY